MMRRILPRSMGGQLLFMLLVSLVISQGLSLFVFSDERDRAVRAALGYEAAGRAANVARLLDEAPLTLRPAIVEAASSPLVRFWVAAEPEVDHASHRDPAVTRRLRDALGDPDREILLEVHDRSSDLPDVDEVPMEMRPMHAAMLAERRGPLELAMSIRLTSGEWLNVRSMFHRPVGQWLPEDIAALAIAAVLVSLVAALTAVRVVRPMRALAIAAERAGRGEDQPELTESGPSEVQDTIRAFNLMQARLRRFVGDRTRMLAALGHDLRSPLTAMRLRLELIDAGEDRDRLMAMVDEMQMMAEATLAFARGDAESEPTVEIDLSEILRDLAASPDHAARIELNETLPSVKARVRPVALRRALRNLIDNALRYGGRAEVSLEYHDGDAVFAISDRGPGLPQDRLEAVFEPFHRLEASRSRETGGSGLGLSIARTILRAHGGDVTLKNRNGGGLTATVRLPT